MASFPNVASEQGISLIENMIGATAVFATSCFLVLILYVFRMVHLIGRWHGEMMNWRNGADGR